MDTVAGISLYFRDNRINIRKSTTEALANPNHVHVRINQENKQLFIEACERDKDAFRLYYQNDQNDDEDNGVKCYLNAKRLLDYLSRLVGVERYSESLRLKGVVMDDKRVVCIDLTDYEVIPY